jgi:glucose dehydrogenase
LVTGFSHNGTNSDYYTAKYAVTDGTLLWEKRYNGPANGSDVPAGVEVDGSGHVVVTGLSHNGSNNDYYTAKYGGTDGSLLWEKRYNGSANGSDSAKAVAVDASGNVIVTGSSYSGGINVDYYTVKYAAADGALGFGKSVTTAPRTVAMCP